MSIPPRQNKLTPEQVVEMRQLYTSGWTQGRLCREFNVSIAQVGRIVRNESWRHLPTAQPTDSQLKLQAQAFYDKMKAEGAIVEETTSIEKMAADIQEKLDKDKEGDKMIEELENATDKRTD